MKKTDQAARTQALDVSTSFLMQAPAGSGKTEVLTQRFLALLGIVEHPEQILALTFTKKAAAEMRHRLLQALYLGQEPAPTQEPALSRWQLAQGVLAANQQKQWHLLSSPHRLRLYTIDSLCATLVKQSPLVVKYSGFRICAQAAPFYEKAVRNTLFAQDQPWLDSLQRLLLYFNTDYGYFQGLLENMLANRDTWIGDAYTITTGLADARFSKQSVLALFEHQLQSVKQALAQRLASGFKDFEWSAFWSLVCFAQGQLGGELDPHLTPEQLEPEHWQTLANIILKKDGDLRQRLDKNCGFATNAKQQKQAMAAQLILLQTLDWPSLQTCLSILQAAPEAYNVDPQHDLAFDIFQLGLAAVQQLELLFVKERQVDYQGLAQSALESLGDDMNPTDVLLRFDYQVQHLLMDEFQDTSNTQMQLFERMTTGWQPGDGRSLFFVGDPMQSIYGFRKADVNLFYQIQKQGLGEMPLHFLQLQRNFRTEPALVKAVQGLLGPLFPKQEDPLLQQVTFAQAWAAKTQNTAQQPCLARLFETHEQEVAWITDQIQAVLKSSQGRIAVLVRKKNQVPSITSAFRQAGIPYTAVDLDPLWAFTSVKDLYHLACVLFETPVAHHFFAVCRAPFVGFGLPALEVVAKLWRSDPGLMRYRLEAVNQGLSLDDHERLLGFLHALDRFQKASALSKVERLRALWFCMLGPETTAISEQQSVDDFWTLLQEQSDQGLNLPRLRTALDQANTSVIDANARVEIMTIHKSKGLEYETVFVPCLDNFSGKGATPLVEALNFQMPNAQQHTLFAVRATTDKTQNSDKANTAKNGPSVAGFIREIVKSRDRNELARLLYVGLTRAQRQLRLSATLKVNSKGLQVPTARSILEGLLPFFEPAQAEQAQMQAQALGEYQSLSAQTLKPLLKSSPYLMPLQKPSNRQPSQYGHFWPTKVQQSLEQKLSQQFGQLIHLWFAQIELEHLQTLKPQQWRSWFVNAIASFGWRLEQEQLMVDACERLVEIIIADETQVLPWLLQAREVRLREQAWQLKATANTQNTPQVLPHQVLPHQVLRPDLVFVESKILWIVDFKVSSLFLQASTCQTSNSPDTLQSIQSAYGDQLSQYAKVFMQEESRHLIHHTDIKLAVYYPKPSGPEFWQWPLVSS